MKNRDFVLFDVFTIIVLMVIFITTMTGCSPVEIKIAEEVVEVVAEEELKEEALKGK